MPIAISPQRAALLIVLEDDNLDRIKQYDPASIDVSKMPAPFREVRFTEVHILYASPQDVEEVKQLVSDGRTDAALRLLTRGWKYRPEQGDHDQAYTSMMRQERDS